MSTTSASSLIEPTAPSAAPAGRKPGRAPGGTLGRYLLVRFLLIFPTVFILVTMVFLLMRTIGDPLTASLGGKLPPAELDKRIHEAGFKATRRNVRYDWLTPPV